MTQTKTQPHSDPAHLELLRVTFDLLANPDDWKAPVRRAVDLADLNAAGATLLTIFEAVLHYTATVPTCRAIQDEQGELVGYYVQADGYRAGAAW